MFQEYFKDIFLATLGHQVYAKLGATLYVPQCLIVAGKKSLDDSLYQSSISEGIYYWDKGADLDNPEVILGETKLQALIAEKAVGKQIFVQMYKSNTKLEKACQNYGWKVAAPPAKLANLFEDKLTFRSLAKKLELNTPNSHVSNLVEIQAHDFAYFSALLGDKLVFQAEGITKDISTTIISSPQEYQNFQETLLKKQLKTPEILVSEFITGLPISMVACTTRYGTLTGELQLQIIDAPAVANVAWRNGIFCGHDWQVMADQTNLKTLVSQQMETFGHYLKTQGFKGMFGIDFMYSASNNQLYALECNPRCTGAFPTYTLFEAQTSPLTLELFHLLENTDAEYPEKLYTQYRDVAHPLHGSHLNLYQKSPVPLRVKRKVAPGLYRYHSKGTLEFVKPSCDFNDLSTHSCLLLDGLPEVGQETSPNTMLGKLVFSDSILNSGTKTLTKECQQIAEMVYNLWFT